MKISRILGLVVLLAAFSMTSCDKDVDDVVVMETEELNLTTEESNGLIVMREEEKLARDVYLYLYDRYQINIFNNIASAEQAHMNSILTLINKYAIADPITEDIRGVFLNPELQSLYNILTAKGDISELEALYVGATIEDLDIYDLNNYRMETENEDILSVYDKLTCGSRNHMRSFSEKIADSNGSYSSQYLTQDEIDIILAGSTEQCGQ